MYSFFKNFFTVKPHLSGRPWSVNTSFIGIWRGPPLPPTASWWVAMTIVVTPLHVSMYKEWWLEAEQNVPINEFARSRYMSVPINECPDKRGFTVLRIFVILFENLKFSYIWNLYFRIKYLIFCQISEFGIRNFVFWYRILNLSPNIWIEDFMILFNVKILLVFQIFKNNLVNL